MADKSTEELTNILGRTHVSLIGNFLSEYSEDMLPDEKAFSFYFRDVLQRKKLTQQEVFLRADIPERYGYKLISEEKHTKQRDIILRLCYAAEFSLEETQKALRIYELPELYAKNKRDALLMICFNDRPGSVLDVNAELKQHGMEILRPSGIQE